MNRRSFLRALGLTFAAVSLSPMLDLALIEPVMSGAASFAQLNTLLKDIYAPAIADILNQRSALYEAFFR